MRKLFFAAVVGTSAVACVGGIDGSHTGDGPGAAKGNGAATAPGAARGSTTGSGPGASSPTPGASTSPGATPGVGATDPALPPGALAPATLHRLTASEYRNAVRDLLGAAVTAPSALEPDAEEAGFSSIGASKLPVSSRGVEQYDGAALGLAQQVFVSPERRVALVGCTPAGPADPCVRGFVERFGKRAFRRPLDAAEIDQYTKLASTVGASFADVWTGLEYTVAGFLQSPMFLYRVELGEPDPTQPGRRRYTAAEMASRLSFVLVQSIPDDALLAAADRGELLTPDGVRTQAKRLLATPRARDSVLRFFREHFDLDRLDNLVKDVKVYPKFTPTLGPAMKREIEMVLTGLFDKAGDFRNLLDGRGTFVNAELAKLYGVAGPTGTTFAAVDLAPTGPRAGIFGLAGMMAMQARATSTSPTLRGKFVRERLLCQVVPAPPPNVETVLPEMGAAGLTMRQRLEQHRKDPTCAGCHAVIDPIGIGLEKYDGLGVVRDSDGGKPIDAHSELDGKPFDGAIELAGLLRGNDATAACVVRQLYRHAGGHLEAGGDEPVIGALAERFKAAGYKLGDLFVDLVASDGFRHAGGI